MWSRSEVDETIAAVQISQSTQQSELLSTNISYRDRLELTGLRVGVALESTYELA